MIRGKHTPLSFKFVLHLMPQYVPGVMKGADPFFKTGTGSGAGPDHKI